MHRRNVFVSLLVAAVALGAAVTAAFAQKAVRFPNAGVTLVPPQGFVTAKSFDGFEQASTGSSVVVVRLPGPFAEVTRGFTADGLKTQRITLRSRQNVTIDGQPGLLLNVTQDAQGTTFGKWIAATGDASQTVLVTASFPDDRSAPLSGKLKATVLSVRKDRPAKPSAPDAGLPFAITPSAKLKPASSIGKTLLYTRDGVIPAKSPSDPLFVVAPSMGKAPMGDPKAFALKRMQQTAQTSAVVVTSHQAVLIDGRNGFETLATAKDASSGTPLRLYQTLLFDGDEYVVMQGLVGSEQAPVYLPEFKAMARSLRWKKGVR